MSGSLPVAVEKASSLKAYAERRGEGIDGYAVVIDDAEGLELLRWWRGVYMNRRFQDEAATALKVGDPWPVLEAFKLLGFPLKRRESLH